MKTALLILALIGASFALQYPVELRYGYQGRVATAIPGIRTLVAGMGIKAELVLQVKSKSQAIAKLTNVEVGEFNGETNCVQLRKPLPIQYSPMSKYAQELEKPFTVNFMETEGQVMLVPQGEEEWLTNIRKSIVEVLLVEPIKANFGGSQGDPIASRITPGRKPFVFSMEEETIFGRCESQYTLTPLPEYLASIEAEVMKTTLKEDIQTSGSSAKTSSIPKLKNEYWRMVRAISFDKCHDRVLVQRSGLANITKMGHGQFEAVFSRSSVGTYILKGEGGSFRVERAVIEGDILTHPFGIKTDKIQTITNQTLILREAREIGSPMRMQSSTSTVKTWRYEIASPFTAPSGSPKPWINYYGKSDKLYPVIPELYTTGMKLTPELIQKFKGDVLRLLDLAVEHLLVLPVPPPEVPTPSGHKNVVALTHLWSASRALRALPLSEIESIFSQVFQMTDKKGLLKQMLLVDITATSGASAPIKVLLEKIRSGHITSERAATIFITLTNHLMSPAIIPEIMEFVKTINLKEKPYLASAALINFATVANRVCLNYKTFNYSVPNPVFGNEICKPEIIISNFLPFLKEKLQSASTTWERAIIVQALSNLGIPQVLPILTPVIYGKIDPNPKVRNTAIYALVHRRMPLYVKNHVYDILMEIIDNLGEDPLVRQTAMSVLLTWKPEPAWWQRMARLTWREPSKQMAAFITFTIESAAKSTDPRFLNQAKIASFVLPLTKPFSPSLMYSYNKLWSRFMPHEMLRTNIDVAWITNLESVVPREMYVFLQNCFGGFHFNIFEIAVAADGLQKPINEVLEQLQLYTNEPSSRQHYGTEPRDRQSRNIHEILTSMKDAMTPEKFVPNKPEANLYLRMFDNMYTFLPLEADVIRRIAGNGGRVILEKLLKGTHIDMTKYIEPIEVEYFMPTELGLPLMGTVSLPVMIMGEAHVKLFVQGKTDLTISELIRARKVELLVKTDYKFLSKLTTTLKVLMPWNREVIGSGVDNVRAINLPIYGNLTLINEREIKNITLNIAPFVNEKLPVIYAHNIPFTVIKTLLPGSDLTKVKSLKVITKNINQEPLIKRRFLANTKVSGLDAYIQYDADVPFPFTTGRIIDYVKHPQNLIKLLVSPTSKLWQTAVVINPSNSPTKNISFSLSYLTLLGSSPSPKVPVSGSDLSPMDTPYERLTKLRKLWPTGPIRSLNAQMFLNGTEYRRFESVLSWVKETSTEQMKKYKTELAFMTERIPGYLESPKAVCWKAEIEAPLVDTLEKLKEKLNSEMIVKTIGKVTIGPTCAGSKLLTFKGLMEMTPERKSIVLKEVEHLCNFDQRNPVVEFRTAAVYDKLEIDIEYQKEKFPRKLLNTTLIIDDLLRGMVFPHGYYNRLDIHNQQSKILIKGLRPLSSDRYTFWTQTPKCNSIVTDIWAPYFVTQITPLKGLHVRHTQSPEVILSSFNKGICEITPEKVITYDGVSFEVSPTPCWTAVAMNKRYPEKWAVYTRTSPSGTPEIQVLASENSISVEVSPTRAIINGREMPQSKTRESVKDNNGRVVVEIVREGSGRFEIMLPGKLTIKLSSSIIKIEPFSILKGVLRGICGDFDMETTYDMTGPKGCIFPISKGREFFYSWTFPRGEGCKHDVLEKEMIPVEEFRKHCPKHSSITGRTSSLYSDESYSCYMYVYPIVRKGALICIAEESIFRCQSTCKMTDTKEKEVPAKCWPMNVAPESVKTLLPQGYSPHPINVPGKTTNRINITVPIKCIKRN